MKIQLYNRDGANLWLEKVKDIKPNISEWKLKVDEKHSYCLEYLRVIGNIKDNKVVDIEAIDPSGGPFLSIGDEISRRTNESYKIVNFLNSTTLWLSERNNNN